MLPLPPRQSPFLRQKNRQVSYSQVDTTSFARQYCCGSPQAGAGMPYDLCLPFCIMKENNCPHAPWPRSDNFCTWKFSAVPSFCNASQDRFANVGRIVEVFGDGPQLMKVRRKGSPAALSNRKGLAGSIREDSTHFGHPTIKVERRKRDIGSSTRSIGRRWEACDDAGTTNRAEQAW